MVFTTICALWHHCIKAFCVEQAGSMKASLETNDLDHTSWFVDLARIVYRRSLRSATAQQPPTATVVIGREGTQKI